MNEIYLDYASSTPVDGDALAAAMPYLNKVFYNPSSTHALGQIARNAIERARSQCAAAINASPDEIYFTSGGTEGVNTVFNVFSDCDVAVSAIEHDSCLACAQNIAKSGHTVNYIQPSGGGIITQESLVGAMTDSTRLVSVMAVNNIVGSVQPIRQLAAAAHKMGALFFTDAVQAVNCVDIDVKDWDVDYLAVSAHKFYGMKGAGFLYVKRGVKCNPLLVGGGQEKGVRAGTQDVPAIVAMGEAIQKAKTNAPIYRHNIKIARDAFLCALDCGRAVDCDNAVPDILSVVFDGVNGGKLAVALSLGGVCCSVGSACSAGSAVPPQTLIAMKVPGADCSVRFSFGRDTTELAAISAAKTVNRVVRTLSGGK